MVVTPGALEPLGVVRDGRVVGRGGVALRLPVVEKGRALPLAGRGRHSPQGPGPEARHIAVVERRSPGIPAGAPGVCLGDGAGDGTALQATRSEGGWSSVCRTAMRPTAPGEGETCRRDV